MVLIREICDENGYGIADHTEVSKLILDETTNRGNI
jgi:hypothetical protein